MCIAMLTSLTLVLCHTCRTVFEAVQLFEVLESLYSCFSGASLVNHHKFMEVQSRLGLTGAELVQLSTTRWACRLASINAVLATLPAIFECLPIIGSSIAVGLKANLSKISTLYGLVMFQQLLSVTEGFHKFLQKETVDLAEALMCKEAVCDTVRGKRTDAFATQLFEQSMALIHTLRIPESRTKRTPMQTHLQDYFVETPVGAHKQLTTS